VGEAAIGLIEVDMIAFLWACLTPFDDPAVAADTRRFERRGVCKVA